MSSFQPALAVPMLTSCIVNPFAVSIVACCFVQLDIRSNANSIITWEKLLVALMALQFDLGAILAQQIPHIDLRIQAYDASTRNFLKAVSNYSNRAVAEITKRKEKHAIESKKLADKSAAVESETNQCKLKEIELVAQLQREREEKSEAEQSVAAYKRQLASLREKCASIDVEIDQYRAVTANIRRGVYSSCLYASLADYSAEKNKERSTLNAHASSASPELKSCEHRLRCVVEGIEKDQLLVRFSHIDKYDLDREFTFVLDVSVRSYRGRLRLHLGANVELMSVSADFDSPPADIADLRRAAE